MPVLAKALYDNAADSVDEVSFRRGDVVTVLESEHAGLSGWALVSHRGRTGIAPSNRLRVLTASALQDGSTSASSTVQSRVLPPTPDSNKLSVHGGGDGGEEGGKTTWNRRSWAVEPDKVSFFLFFFLFVDFILESFNCFPHNHTVFPLLFSSFVLDIFMMQSSPFNDYNSNLLF